MSKAHAPVRTCIGCRTRREQDRLTRFVPNADGQPLASRTAPGRGAWICADSASCREQADKKRAFERAWKTRSAASTRTKTNTRTMMKSRTTMAH